MSEDVPYSAAGDGVRLAVRLTPRASRNGLDGIVKGADGRPVVQLRLNAPPVDGAANTALLGFLAEVLKLRKADIAIRSGHTSRLKLIQLTGDPTQILARLEAWLKV